MNSGKTITTLIDGEEKGKCGWPLSNSGIKTTSLCIVENPHVTSDPPKMLTTNSLLLAEALPIKQLIHMFVCFVCS